MFLGLVDEDSVLNEPESAMVNNPTFYSSHSFCDNQDLMTQRTNALEIGSKAFEQQLSKLTSEHFSRQLLDNICSKESSMLNDLLISCNCTTTMTGYTFTIKRDVIVISSQLFTRSKTHSNLILTEQYAIPELLLWGIKAISLSFI